MSRNLLEDTAVLLKVAQLLADRGVRALTGEAIAAHLGVAAGELPAKEEFVEAVSLYYLGQLEPRWQRRLDALMLADTLDPRDVIWALMEPVCELSDDDPAWVFIAADLSTMPRYQLRERPVLSSPLFARFFGLLFQSTTPPPPRLTDVRLQRFGATVYQSLAYRLRAEQQDIEQLPRDLYLSNLVDVAVAILEAPASEQTAELM